MHCAIELCTGVYIVCTLVIIIIINYYYYVIVLLLLLLLSIISLCIERSMVVVDFDRAPFDRGNVKRNSSCEGRTAAIVPRSSSTVKQFSGKNCEIAFSTSTIPNAFSHVSHLGKYFRSPGQQERISVIRCEDLSFDFFNHYLPSSVPRIAEYCEREKERIDTARRTRNVDYSALAKTVRCVRRFRCLNYSL